MPQPRARTRSALPAFIGMTLGPCSLAAGIFFLSPIGSGIVGQGLAVTLICVGLALLIIAILRIASFGSVVPAQTKADPKEGRR